MNETYAAEFPLDPEIVHLNHAGVAPWPRRAVQAVQAFAEENMRRGTLAYRDWLEREASLRARLATLINAPSPDDVALLHSTSEGLSVVAYGLDWREGDNVVFAAQEFPSNRIVWESLAPRFGVEARAVDLSAGETPEDALLARVDGRTRLLAVSAVQYASGLRMDLERLGAACRDRGVLFCVDAIQAIGALPFDAQAVGADFVAADGHKWLLGPEGIALFYCRAELRERLRLQQFGWHMVAQSQDFESRSWSPAASARRFEPGSPNMLGTFALHESVGLLLEIGLDSVAEMISRKTSYLIEIAKLYDLEVLSPTTPDRRAGIVVLRHAAADSQRLYQGLMQAGILCALRAGGVRFSPHFYTPTESIDRALGQLRALVGHP